MKDLWDDFLAWLPTKLSKRIAAVTWSLTAGTGILSVFLQNIGMSLSPEATLLLRFALPLALCLVGSWVLFYVVVKHFKNQPKPESQNPLPEPVQNSIPKGPRSALPENHPLRIKRGW